MRRMQQNELPNFGVFWTDRRRYAPLDEAQVTFECRGGGSRSYLFVVYDGAGRPYSSEEVFASDGVAEFTVTVGGTPGLHVVRAFKDTKPSF